MKKSNIIAYSKEELTKVKDHLDPDRSYGRV